MRQLSQVRKLYHWGTGCTHLQKCSQTDSQRYHLGTGLDELHRLCRSSLQCSSCRLCHASHLGTSRRHLKARIKIAMAERRHRSRYEYRARCCLDSHGWQRLVRVASENEPGLHGVWTVAPAPQKLPFGQSSHCSAACKPVSDEYVPATQTSSADEPFGQNRPGPQMEHAVAPDPVW